MAIEDLRRAADLFATIHQRTATVDGWVSLEVSPLLAYDARTTVEVAKALHQKAAAPICSSRFPAQPKGDRHRRSDLCRGLGERDFAVQPRTLSRRSRSLYARAGAAREAASARTFVP